MSRETESVLWVHLVPPGDDSGSSVQTFIVYLQLLGDGFELRLTDFIQLWSKSYATSVTGASHRDLQELNEALAQGWAEVQVQVENAGPATLVWQGHSHIVLGSAGPVSAQELQPLVVHAVQRMHTSQQSLLALERKLEHEKLTHPLQTEHTATVNAAPVPKARRPPGQSIVNPLNKRKRAAGGVQFNDH